MFAPHEQKGITENMSLNEIAEVFGISKQTVSRTLISALDKLRAELEKRGIHSDELHALFHLEDDVGDALTAQCHL